MRRVAVNSIPSTAVLLIGAMLIAAPFLQAGGDDSKRINLDKLISIKFEKEKYVLTLEEAAKGVKFNYQIIVKEDIPGMIPRRQTSATLESPSGLLPLPKISGNGQLYAILDVGLGPRSPRIPKTIKKGVYKRSMEWDGRNWTGPSDFNNPKGKPFPPGEYVFSVTMVGEKKTDAGLKVYKVSRSVKVILKK